MPRRRSLKTSVPSLWRIFSRFWPQIRKQRLLIVGSTACLFAEVFFRLLAPWPLKFIFDRVIVNTPAGGSSGIAAIDALDSLTLLTVAAVALILIASVRALLYYLNRVGFALAGSRALSNSRSELFAHMQRLSLSFHNKRKTGDLVTRITGDIGRIKEIAVRAAMPLAAHAITLIGMMAVMFWMDWRLSLVSLAILPLFLLSARRLGGRIRQVARKQRQRQGEIGASTTEAITSIKVVQTLSLEEIQQRTFGAHNRSELREGVKLRRLSARLVGTADVLISVGTAIVLWYGARQVLRGVLTPGDLIVFLAYLKSAFRPMRDLAKYTGRLSKAAASAERIIEVLDITPLIRNQPGAVKAPRTITELCFEDVSFEYEPGHLVLEGFSLAASPGQVIALAGPSGAGKSTVLSLLLRLYDPLSGRIMFNGRDIRQYTIESLRPRIAVVPQDNVLFGVSLRDNIAYGAPGASDAQIVAAAKMARAHKFITALPHGYETVLGERGETLSEGQRQRIAIARAAVRAAPILVLDEPTASLDNENNQRIREALRELSKDRISFIIAHDLSTVEEADLILYLEHGRVVEQGTHARLMRRGGRYAAMYALQKHHLDRPHLGSVHAVPS
ncbi:MAG: ABC transporter ATP-binding protein [Phycisphaerales bacterium]